MNTKFDPNSKLSQKAQNPTEAELLSVKQKAEVAWGATVASEGLKNDPVLSKIKAAIDDLPNLGDVACLANNIFWDMVSEMIVAVRAGPDQPLVMEPDHQKFDSELFLLIETRMNKGGSYQQVATSLTIALCSLAIMELSIDTLEEQLLDLLREAVKVVKASGMGRIHYHKDFLPEHQDAKGDKYLLVGETRFSFSGISSAAVKKGLQGQPAHRQLAALGLIGLLPLNKAAFPLPESFC